MTTPKRREGETWQIERKIPLALLFAIALQTIGLIAFLTSLDGRVGVLEEDKLAKAGQGESIIRIDEQLKNVRAELVEIKALLRPVPASTAVQPQR